LPKLQPGGDSAWRGDRRGRARDWPTCGPCP
jgi:hypothetical protein